jgi:hypothetical protein
MAGWNGTPDTINKSGFSKTVNLYLMMDYPFKTNPNLSIGFGAGIASDHILFTKTDVGINKNTSQLFLPMFQTRIIIKKQNWPPLIWKHLLSFVIPLLPLPAKVSNLP